MEKEKEDSMSKASEAKIKLESDSIKALQVQVELVLNDKPRLKSERPISEQVIFTYEQKKKVLER